MFTMAMKRYDYITEEEESQEERKTGRAKEKKEKGRES
jgi:hypothetical protein